MVVINAIFPVFALIMLGVVLKKKRIVTEPVLNSIDQLVYFIFFPAMLFWKIGGAASVLDANILRLCTGALIAVCMAWLAGLFFIRFFFVPRFKAGTFSQAVFRFNSYIGLAVVMNTFGEEGIQVFGILIGVIIPVINTLSIISLVWYGKKRKTAKETLISIAKAFFSNPLILGCGAGILFSRMPFTFPSFLENTFAILASATMPLALISIGGSLKVSADSKTDLKLSLSAAAIKLLILPLIGGALLAGLNVGGNLWSIGLIYFALPTSPAIFVLSSQMDSDTRLASTAILISTLLSFFSLSAVLCLVL